jgi:hypothetical protein
MRLAARCNMMAPRHLSSTAIQDKIRALESVVQVDPGGRGIGAFTPPLGQLAAAAAALLRLRGTDETLAILTGFPCNLDFDPPTETDGPLGAVTIARAFLAATSGGAPAPACVILVDDCNAAVMRAAVGAAALDPARLRVEAFPPVWSAADAARFAAIDQRAASVRPSLHPRGALSLGHNRPPWSPRCLTGVAFGR